MRMGKFNMFLKSNVRSHVWQERFKVGSYCHDRGLREERNLILGTQM